MFTLTPTKVVNERQNFEKVETNHRKVENSASLAIGPHTD